MAEKMVNYVEGLFTQSGGHLIDLYGGVGVFGISLSNKFDQVSIIESSPLSIECAMQNIKSLGAGNCSAILTDAAKVDKIRANGKLSVITDPPRTGMGRMAIEKLLSLEPEKIIYVSCNPAQLSKELKFFFNSGYMVKSCALFDLFPQTNHFEIVYELSRA